MKRFLQLQSADVAAMFPRPYFNDDGRLGLPCIGAAIPAEIRSEELRDEIAEAAQSVIKCALSKAIALAKAEAIEEARETLRTLDPESKAEGK